MSAKVSDAMAPLLLSRNVGAPREILWRYLSTAAGLASWQADSVEGGLEQGGFSLTWPQLGARLDLTVAEVEPGHRLVLRTGDNLLDMSVGEGRISLSHHGLHPDDDLIGLESSWHTALSLLQIAATRHPEKTRRVHWLFHPILGTAELAHHYFTDARGIGSWLGSTARDLIVDSFFELQLNKAQKLSGEVLSAGRDVCLRINELGDGALALRTLPGPEGKRMAALGISSWNPEPADTLIELMEDALVRLSHIMSGTRIH